ncbi:MAG: glucokinase [Anaerolineae bacterium]|nr:MAG: glucokinase [Anaerolineae bacterium]
MLLAGDIGGTKTNVAVYSPDAGPRAPLAEATFPSARYANLEALVCDFLGGIDLAVDWASFGVAGPVVGGRATITNLPWVIDETQLEGELGLSAVRLLNDLEAIAYAVPWLEPDDVYTLNEGQPAPGGSMAIVAPGTGLGEAYLTWDGTRYRAYASEGGHSDFAPTTPLEVELLRYLLSRFDHVSYERVCSGLGVPNIYAYLKESDYADEPAWLAEQLAAADDPTPVIANAALLRHRPPLDGERPCELCVATLNAFVSILGAEAGNLALKVLATGGVYLGGGIPPRILPALEQERFMEAFRRKGRMSDLLARMPVHVILNPKVALLGAAYHGLEM